MISLEVTVYRLGISVAVVSTLVFASLACFWRPWPLEWAWILGVLVNGGSIWYSFFRPHNLSDSDTSRLVFPELPPLALVLLYILAGLFVNAIDLSLAIDLFCGNLLLLVCVIIFVLDGFVIFLRFDIHRRLEFDAAMERLRVKQKEQEEGEEGKPTKGPPVS